VTDQVDLEKSTHVPSCILTNLLSYLSTADYTTGYETFRSKM